MATRLSRLACVLALAAIIAGCGAATTSPPPTGERFTVYVVGAVASGSTFWDTVRRGAEQAAADLNVDLVFAAPDQHSTEGMIPVLRSAIAAKPAGIAIVYLDKSIEAPTLEALDAGIPVTLYNNARFEAAANDPGSATTNPRVTSLPYVGSDIYGGAQRLGAALATRLQPGARIIVINPVPGIQVLALRRDGALDSLTAAGMVYVEEIPAGLDEAANEVLIEAYLDAHSDIGGIVALGTPTGNPAARVVAKRNLSIPVGTFDIDTQALELIRAGSLTVTLDQQPWLQGYGSVWNLVMKVRYGMAMADIDTGKSVVDRSNVEDVAKAVEAGR